MTHNLDDHLDALRSWNRQKRKSKWGSDDEGDYGQEVCVRAGDTKQVYFVERKFIANVIGKDAVQMKSIMQQSGAKVSINAKKSNDDPVPVAIAGSLAAIETAKSLIAEVVSKSQYESENVIFVPRNKIGKVFGLKGATSLRIQAETGVKLDVNKDIDPCEVRLRGATDSVRLARHVIDTLTMETADSGSDYLVFPRVAAGAILGTRGSRLNECQRLSGAQIDIDKTNPTNCYVRISGLPEQIEAAKYLVTEASRTPAPTMGQDNLQLSQLLGQFSWTANAGDAVGAAILGAYSKMEQGNNAGVGGSVVQDSAQTGGAFNFVSWNDPSAPAPPAAHTADVACAPPSFPTQIEQKRPSRSTPFVPSLKTLEFRKTDDFEEIVKEETDQDNFKEYSDENDDQYFEEGCEDQEVACQNVAWDVNGNDDDDDDEHSVAHDFGDDYGHEATYRHRESSSRYGKGSSKDRGYDRHRARDSRGHDRHRSRDLAGPRQGAYISGPSSKPGAKRHHSGFESHRSIPTPKIPRLSRFPPRSSSRPH